MGTNFYADIHFEGAPCPTCGQGHAGVRPIHIGKSSAGWAFAFSTYGRDEWAGRYQYALPDVNFIATCTDWIRLLSRDNVTIRNEYGELVPLVTFLPKIFRRRNHGTSTESNHNAERGVYNLWFPKTNSANPHVRRSAIQDATWYYVTHEFS